MQYHISPRRLGSLLNCVSQYESGEHSTLHRQYSTSSFLNARNKSDFCLNETRMLDIGLQRAKRNLRAVLMAGFVIEGESCPLGSFHQTSKNTKCRYLILSKYCVFYSDLAVRQPRRCQLSYEINASFFITARAGIPSNHYDFRRKYIQKQRFFLDRKENVLMVFRNRPDLDS